jgi:site-specific DNA recombinase
MSKRAPIYARVSTKDQKDCGYSLPTQIEACAAYATERGYMLVGEPFQDDYTGMSMDRPALNKLREAIPAAHIDVVIVLDLDRLARKAVYQMLLEEEFAKLGAVVEYANERYEDTDEA